MIFTLAKRNKDFMTGKREDFKALSKGDHSSTFTDQVKTTGHYIKWDH